jgi:hypothetical protein
LTPLLLATLVDPQQTRRSRLQSDVGLDDTNEEHAETSLLGLDFVKEMLPIVEEAREKVTDLMEDMVVRGLRDLVRIVQPAEISYTSTDTMLRLIFCLSSASLLLF